MADSAPPDLDALRQLNDSGYGFYRVPARLRHDDLMLRGRAADALHRAAAFVCLAEQRARRALPPLTREQPMPDPALMAAIRALKQTQDRIAAVETRLRGAAALPDKDFSRLIPSEAVRLELVALDAALLAGAEALEKAASQAGEVGLALDAIEAAIGARDALAARAKPG
jgi:hypothetical protein